jgi:plasmid stabilization system protein ParE
VKISLNVQAELELVEGAAYYAREANADIANAFISEFNRSATLLSEFPKLGATWRGRVRRLPLPGAVEQVVRRGHAAALRRKPCAGAYVTRRNATACRSTPT